MSRARVSGYGLSFGILILGVYWAYTRGANDFDVFYAAFHHVLAGEGSEIYRVSPDRFLYAPGFAWMGVPFAVFSEPAALALWSLLKFVTLAALILRLTRGRPDIAAFGAFVVARPLLIDFQYGQVNSLILVASAWALLHHAEGEASPWKDRLSWFFLGLAAVVKLFALPLLLVPFWVRRFGDLEISREKLARERIGAGVGAAAALILPVLGAGFSGTLSLMREWKTALMNRGLPLESHNQSFAALLNHLASGNPTEIISQHRREINVGWLLLNQSQINGIAIAWGVLLIALLLFVLFVSPRRSTRLDPRVWAGAVCMLQILPSHLVWKPYFLMALPLATVALERTVAGKAQRRLWQIALWLSVILMNFSGFDFLGQEWGARAEAVCAMFIAFFVLFLPFVRELLSQRTSAAET